MIVPLLTVALVPAWFIIFLLNFFFINGTEGPGFGLSQIKSSSQSIASCLNKQIILKEKNVLKRKLVWKRTYIFFTGW